MHRVELDLGVAAQRQRWPQEFVAPVDAALATLPTRGVRVHVLSSDSPSESWLPSSAGPRAACWRVRPLLCVTSTIRLRRLDGSVHRESGGVRPWDREGR